MNTRRTYNQNQPVSAEEIARNHFQSNNMHGDPNAAGEAYVDFYNKILTDALAGDRTLSGDQQALKAAIEKIALNSYLYEAHRSPPQGIIKMLMGDDPHIISEKMNHDIREKAAYNARIGYKYQPMEEIMDEYSQAVILTYSELKSNQDMTRYAENPTKEGTISRCGWGRVETSIKTSLPHKKQINGREESRMIDMTVGLWYQFYLEQMMQYLTGSDKEVSPPSTSVQSFFVSEYGTTSINPLFPPSWTTGCAATLDPNGEITEDGFDMTISPAARLARLIQKGTGSISSSSYVYLFNCLSSIGPLMSNPIMRIPYIDNPMKRHIRGIVLLPQPMYDQVYKDCLLNISQSNKTEMARYNSKKSNHFIDFNWLICRMDVWQEWRAGDVIPVGRNHEGETAWVNFSGTANSISNGAAQREEAGQAPFNWSTDKDNPTSIGAIPKDRVLYRIPILVGNALMLIHKNDRPIRHPFYYYDLGIKEQSMGDYGKYANTFMPITFAEEFDNRNRQYGYSSISYYGMNKLREAVKLHLNGELVNSIKDMGSFTLDMLVSDKP